MPSLQIRGVEHYYEWITTSDQLLPSGQPISDKPIMVFVHGWGGSLRYWRSTAEALSNSFECLLYDLRGFGRSRLSRPISSEVKALDYELETYADDLAILLDQFGLDQVYLNAHSTGASVAVLFLDRYPQRVRQAILTCHGVFEYNPFTFKAFHKAGGYVVAFRPNWFKRIPGIEHMFMSRFLRRPIPNQAKREFLEDFLLADSEAAVGTIYTAVSQKAALEMPQAYARLQVPALLISGEYDQIIPVKLGRLAASQNSAVKHVIIPNTGHFPMLEDAATYLQLVREFVQVPEGASNQG